MCPASLPASVRQSPGQGESSPNAARASSLESARRWAETHLDYAPRSVIRNVEGTSVDVLILDRRHTVRVAKTPEAARLLADEITTLQAIAGQMPVAVPEVLAARDGVSLQTYVPGEPLTRRRLLRLEASRRQAILEQMAEFLAAFQGAAARIPHPAPCPHDRRDFADLRARADRVLFPRLPATLRTELIAILDDLDGCGLDESRPGVIHGDLHPSHLLIDPATDRFTGIIDFGLAGRADPAIDLAGLWYNWGDPAADVLCRDPLLRAKAKFYARTYELQWAVEALENDRPDWLLYAMGAAKAISADEA